MSVDNSKTWAQKIREEPSAREDLHFDFRSMKVFHKENGAEVIEIRRVEANDWSWKWTRSKLWSHMSSKDSANLERWYAAWLSSEILS